jgi:hypothetical protein
MSRYDDGVRSLCHSLGLATVVASLAFACASRPSVDCRNLRSVEREAQLRTFRYPNGTVSATGRGLPESWDDEFERWATASKRDVPATRVGRWRYFYAAGTKRAEVSYALACYIQCCTGGACPQIHDYPVGAFRLWYPSGRKLAEGSFVAVKWHVETSCEGGDDTTVARISSDSRFWREDESAMTVGEARAAGYLLAGW